MRFVFSGGWIGKKGLWQADVKGVKELGLEDLNQFEGFVVVSYDLTEEVLSVPVKTSGLPPLLAVDIENVRAFEGKPGEVSLNLLSSSLSEEGFLKGIEKVKGYIERGDVYQINLTNRFDFELSSDPLDLFLGFYERQPVPYAFFLDTGDLYIISGSMELFLEKRANRIVSKPIKGTGKTPQEILSSEKEKAENLMITDMMRNDLGRVSRTGSVRVEELFKVERYRTLCQMHSTVVGETDMGLPHILRETFPPASVTGAPKVRAVQVIEELEPHPRGYYCGAAGFVKGNGDFTLSVLIRTAYGGGSRLSYFAGCGIVWDSDPRRELEELHLKVKAFYP